MSSASSVNPELRRLARRYLAALDTFLRGGRRADARPARALGKRALAIGQETLSLARIHEEALITLVHPHYSTRTSDAMIRRAGEFFAEALIPIEETHRGALEANISLKQMIAALSQQAQELAATNKKLRDEIVQRREVEHSLRGSEQASGQLLEKSRRMQEELRYLSRKVLSTQEEERRRISRELHDVIAQMLTSINVRLTTLKTESATGSRALQQSISRTQRLVERSVDIVHRFARELRPTVLDDLGLIPALKSLLEGFLKETGVRVNLKAFAGIEQAGGAVRTVLYRVVQESLTNVSRHARASLAEVGIQKRGSVIHMEIRDNGVGFAVEGTTTARSSQRLGLLGMRERVEMIGGVFCVVSAPDRGTVIRVEVPWKERASNHVKKRPPARSPRSSSFRSP